MKARVPRPVSPKPFSEASSQPLRPASREPGRPRREAEELDEVFESVARYFALLAEPMRLRILNAICRDERSVSAIVAATGATQTNVSRHLALMHQAGVVARRREGSTVYYRLLDPEFAQICRSMCVRVAGRIEADEPLKQDLLDYAGMVR
jgi:DNA-binding transcriptional ArsR family regulator